MLFFKVYASTIHKVQYSSFTKTSPHWLMFNETPDGLVFSNSVARPGFIVAWISVLIPNMMPAGNLLYLWDTPPIRKVSRTLPQFVGGFK